MTEKLWWNYRKKIVVLKKYDRKIIGIQEVPYKTYISKIWVYSWHNVHIRLRYKTSLVLRQVQEVSTALLKFIHLSYSFRVEGLAHRVVLFEV